MNDKEQLTNLYLEDLGRLVCWGGRERPRSHKLGLWKATANTLKDQEAIPLDTARKVWVWSDQHFGHKNIIGFSNRPFANVHHMEIEMIKRHNSIVQPEDICIWGGDVGFMPDAAINKILEMCNGYKILIVGNHDFNKGKLRNLNFDEMHVVYPIEIDDIKLVFTHYDMANVPSPWINIHGHVHISHAHTITKPQFINVNCELHDYVPLSLDQLIQTAKMRLLEIEGRNARRNLSRVRRG